MFVPAYRVCRFGQPEQVQYGPLLGQSSIRVPNGDAVIRTIAIVANGKQVGVRLVPCQTYAGSGLFGGWIEGECD